MPRLRDHRGNVHRPEEWRGQKNSTDWPSQYGRHRDSANRAVSKDGATFQAPQADWLVRSRGWLSYGFWTSVYYRQDMPLSGRHTWTEVCRACLFIFYHFIYLFLSVLCLRCSARLLSAVASLAVEHEFQQFWHVGSGVPQVQSPASTVVAPGLSCSLACGIFLDQGLNLCLPHWQAGSFTTELPGKPQDLYWWDFIVKYGDIRRGFLLKRGSDLLHSIGLELLSLFLVPREETNICPIQYCTYLYQYVFYCVVFRVTVQLTPKPLKGPPT